MDFLLKPKSINLYEKIHLTLASWAITPGDLLNSSFKDKALSAWRDQWLLAQYAQLYFNWDSEFK